MFMSAQLNHRLQYDTAKTEHWFKMQRGWSGMVHNTPHATEISADQQAVQRTLMDLWLYKDHTLRNADLINRIKEVKSTTYEYFIMQFYVTFWKCSKLTLTNSKSPSTKGLWNLAWFSWWCLAWKGSAVGGWWSGPPPPAPEIWFNCRCRWFWNLCLSSADSCGDCCGDGTTALCWGCTELALFCDDDTLALGDTLEWALVRTSAPDSLWDGETWGWPLPWTKEKNCIKSPNSLLQADHTLDGHFSGQG